MTYKIDSDVPIPKDPRGRLSVYPFREMTVGDSFFAGDLKIGSARGAATQYAKRHGIKFTSRKQTEGGIDGIRVWRVE